MPDRNEGWSGVEPVDHIALKSVCSIIPGYGPLGEEFGTLVPTDHIVAGIHPAQPRAGSPDLPVSFLADKLGIKSVATTNTTTNVARAVIDKGLDWAQGAVEVPKPATNPDIVTMLTRAMDTALVRHEEVLGHRIERDRSIAGHLHFASAADTAAPFALPVCRRDVGCHKPGLPMEFLVSGCAALLYSLRHAGFLLQHTEARHDPDAYVIITAASDMLPFAHARSQAPTDYRADIDSWLFQAIFGEGVGAIVVGHPGPTGHDWIVEDNQWHAVTDDWRVNLSDDDVPHVDIRARDVSTTFRRNVPDIARNGLQALGLSEFEDLHRLCIHESNPNLVSAIAGELGVPAGIVHSISSQVGTLAGVSAFSLLDEAFQTHEQTEDAHDSIACALIGENGQAVIAGHLALRHAAY
jgi:3-oxoacyl-[acyl-carrier-protein] synthase III